MDGIKKRRSERDRSGDSQVIGVIPFALAASSGVGVIDEDAVGADQVGLEGPFERIWVEVAEEDVDEERVVQSVFLDSDVGDPFTILAVLGCGVAGNLLGDWVQCQFPDRDHRFLVDATVESSRRNQA